MGNCRWGYPSIKKEGKNSAKSQEAGTIFMADL
jgi:hypothetical protein